MRIRSVMWIPAAVAILAVIGLCPAAHAEEGRAVAAMRVALQRENSARVMYLAYASEADGECCGEIAALFRALAAAESVHVRNHFIALGLPGGTPIAGAEPVVVGTTIENLRSAIDAEVFERRVAYPQFMRYARDECQYDLLASFRYARDAEKTHAVRLAIALARLESGGPLVASAAVGPAPELGRVAYQVCIGCGRVCCAATAKHCECGTSATRCVTFEAPGLQSMPALMSWR